MTTEKNEDVEFLVEHLQKHPDSILFARLADVYLKMNRVDEAIQLCESGIKKHPYYITGHMVLGKAYLANKMHDQAEKEFKRVLLFDPKYLAAHKLYGDLMQEIGWQNTCEMSYKKILQIDPLDEVARSRVGEYIIQNESDTEEAYPRPAASNMDIDIDAMAPVSDTPVDEELLFENGDSESESQSSFSEPESDLDEKKEEEFSSILDDIFKDEVVQQKPAQDKTSHDSGSEDEDLISELQENPERYFPETESENRFRFREPDVPEQQESESFESKQTANKETTTEELPQKTPKSPKSSGQKIVTPTLGEIYAAQGQYAKAIDVFELLLSKHPENESYAKKIEMLKKKLEEAKNAQKPKN